MCHHDAKSQVASQKLVVWIDLESAYLRVSNHKAFDEKKLLNVCIGRLLAYIGTNFPSKQFEVMYLPRELNKGANALSCWKSESGCIRLGNENGELVLGREKGSISETSITCKMVILAILK